jgi:hypothetical protein
MNRGWRKKRSMGGRRFIDVMLHSFVHYQTTHALPMVSDLRQLPWLCQRHGDDQAPCGFVNISFHGVFDLSGVLMCAHCVYVPCELCLLFAYFSCHCILHLRSMLAVSGAAGSHGYFPVRIAIHYFSSLKKTTRSFLPNGVKYEWR